MNQPESIRARLEDYASERGGYKDSNDCWHEDTTDLIQNGILGFCACGGPEENLAYILGGLELIDERHEAEAAGWDWKAWEAKCVQHFGNIEAAYFFWYWADKERLTEHGGSVPGWLDERGHHLLGLLREWKGVTNEPT
jgi:hypothetical protein